MENRGERIWRPTLPPVLVMLNLVTVRTKNSALLNLSFHRFYREAAANHIRHVEILLPAFVVMEL